MEIKDKVVIVTGASSGIGLATAKLLTEDGAKVALVARSKDKLDQISKTLPRSLAVKADMTRPDEIAKMIQTVKNHFGRIDVLINNAGRGYDAPVEKTNIETVRKIFDLDLIGPLIAMQLVIPIMRGQGGGVIVNISSGTALMHLPNMAAYSSIKRALADISLTAREELKKDRIRVGVVYPYMTQTDFEKNTIKDFVEEAPPGEGPRFKPPPPDPAEYIAQKIVDGIRNEAAEIVAHDWMKK
ncbi:MAG TPA: SDR family oxidoreductase [Nitrospiria bacterium]|nr:SDR family oxidoreductase [Nitrospiria bacterium]